MSRELGRSVIVLNKPGGSGVVAVHSILATQAADTQVLLTPEHAPILLPLLSREAGFDSSQDLVALGQVAEFPFAIAVAPSHSTGDLRQFIAMLRRQGKPLTFGTPVFGGAPHLVGYSLAVHSKLGAEPISYQGGAPMVRDLMGGHLEAGILGVQDFAQLHRTARLRVLAVTGNSRSALLPDVPTFKEQGVDNLEIRSWLAFFAKRGTSEGFRNSFSAALRIAIASPDTSERLKNMALESAYLDQSASAASFAQAIAFWSHLARSAGVKQQ